MSGDEQQPSRGAQQPSRGAQQPSRGAQQLSRGAQQLLARALTLSEEVLAAAGRGDLPALGRLDAERLRLLESVRLERNRLSGGDWSLIRQICELNDQAIGLIEHLRRNKERELDMAAVGRRAVAAYSTTQSR
jgi:hypothetical protein